MNNSLRWAFAKHCIKIRWKNRSLVAPFDRVYLKNRKTWDRDHHYYQKPYRYILFLINLCRYNGIQTQPNEFNNKKTHQNWIENNNSKYGKLCSLTSFWEMWVNYLFFKCSINNSFTRTFYIKIGWKVKMCKCWKLVFFVPSSSVITLRSRLLSIHHSLGYRRCVLFWSSVKDRGNPLTYERKLSSQ